MAITRLRLTVTPALFGTALGVTGLSGSWRVRRPMARLTCRRRRAGPILLGLAAAWALQLLGTDRCEVDGAEPRSSLPELSEAQPDLGAANRARNQWPRFAVACAN
jgi:hypothetical protein